jgi:hypothetical protein
MLRRLAILTLCELCLLGAGSLGCGSDHGGSNNLGPAGSTGNVNSGGTDQTGYTFGGSGTGGVPGQGPGSAGNGTGAGAQGGSGPSNSAHVQFVLKEVH